MEETVESEHAPRAGTTPDGALPATSGARSRPLRVAVIGAGPGGLCTGIKLLEAGIDQFTIFDPEPGVGGTWRRNTYPGAECDVPSHLYSFSFELNPGWSRPFSGQPEILPYFEGIARTYGLGPHLRLNTAVTALHWDNECQVWRVVLDTAEVLTFDAVVSGVGMFGEPFWPEIPDIDRFEGTIFHSAKWDHDHDLAGERVAVIGSAASAVQFIPEIAKVTGQLHVFQRTANWVLPKDDTPYSLEQLEEFRTDPMAARRLRDKTWCVYDEIMTLTNEDMLAASEAAGRKNLAVVEDPEVRAKLTPTHPFGCKRPLASNVYYPVFNRPDVELVTDPIVEITEKSLVTADGTERVVDTIVLATGFTTTKYVSSIEVTGRKGRQLEEDWADGPEAYLGSTVPGYPNLFQLYGPNTNNGSILFMIECQVAYAVRQIRRLRDEGLATIEVKREVVDRFNEELQEEMAKIRVWQAGCPGYYRSPSGRIVTQWPWPMSEYRRRALRPDPENYDAEPGDVLA